MSVQNATVSVGATVSSTGGTSRSYIVTGKKVVDGVHLVQSDATSGITAKHAYAVSKEPGMRKDGEFLLGQRSIRFVNPKLSSKGNYVYPSIEVILRPHPESTQAELDELKQLAAQGIIDTDFTNLFNVGSLS